MTRPIVWACDKCGVEARTDDYAMPDGWIRVKAHVYPHSEAQGEFCALCALCVDTVALALSGRVIEVAKPRKAKAKDPELPMS